MFVVVGVLVGMGLVWLVVAGLVLRLAGGVRVVAWVVSAFAARAALASGLVCWWAGGLAAATFVCHEGYGGCGSLRT